MKIIIIIIIIIIISFMQGIYTYIPETNYILREYSVAAILLLLFMVLISLVPVLNLSYFYISTFRSMCAVPKMAVFCSSLTSCFPGYYYYYYYYYYVLLIQQRSWPGRSVPIATELRAGRSGIECRWGRDFPPVQTGPGAHPATCKMGTESCPGVKCGRGVLLTTHPLLVPRTWKSRAIPLPTLWATPGL